MHKLIRKLVPIGTISYLILYIILEFLEQKDTAKNILFIGLILGSLPIFTKLIKDFLKGSIGIDFIALITISASILLGEYIAGSIILLMISGGEFLEDFALRRSRSELSKLLNIAPNIAHKIDDDNVSDIPAIEVKPGYILMVKKGEIIPVDGKIVKGKTQLDTSTLTGESIFTEKGVGNTVFSGSVNQGEVIIIRAEKDSKNSKYQQIVELVKRAEKEKAPYVRLADKYSVYFTLIALLIAGIAWISSGDPIRGLTVLVVATPCPLILATPIAFTSGISKSAKLGTILKSGGVLEVMSHAKTFVFDKTGTLTLGTPRIMNINTYDKEYSRNDILMLTADLELISDHVIAKSILNEAKNQNIDLEFPSDAEEKLGYGIKGKIGNKLIIVGKPKYIQENGVEIDKDIIKSFSHDKESGIIKILVSDQTHLIGEISLEDKPRENIRELFQGLENEGITKVMMITGDRDEVAKKIASNYGIKHYLANTLPEDKLKEISKLKSNGFSPVIMVGDGVNDAPALAAADAGIAMGEKGINASTDIADVVIVDGDIFKIVKLVRLSKDVVSIATQGIFIGIGLSLILMILGAFGLFTPVFGAMAQEVIDIIVIFNALRVLNR